MDALADGYLTHHTRKLSTVHGGKFHLDAVMESVAEECKKGLGLAIESGRLLALPRTDSTRSEVLYDTEQKKRDRPIVICDGESMYAAVTMSVLETKNDRGGGADKMDVEFLCKFVRSTYRTTLGEIDFRQHFDQAFSKWKQMHEPKELQSAGRTLSVNQLGESQHGYDYDKPAESAKRPRPKSPTRQRPTERIVDVDDTANVVLKKRRRSALSSSSERSSDDSRRRRAKEPKKDTHRAKSVGVSSRGEKEERVFASRKRSSSKDARRNRSESPDKNDQIEGHPLCESDGGFKLKVEILSGSVQNLSNDIMKTVFADFGEVTNVNMHRDEAFAYVTFRSISSAKDAGVAMNASRSGVKGQRVRCIWAPWPDHLIGYRRCHTCARKEPRTRYCDEVDSRYRTKEERRAEKRQLARSTSKHVRRSPAGKDRTRREKERDRRKERDPSSSESVCVEPTAWVELPAKRPIKRTVSSPVRKDMDSVSSSSDTRRHRNDNVTLPGVKPSKKQPRRSSPPRKILVRQSSPDLPTKSASKSSFTATISSNASKQRPAAQRPPSPPPSFSRVKAPPPAHDAPGRKVRSPPDYRRVDPIVALVDAASRPPPPPPPPRPCAVPSTARLNSPVVVSSTTTANRSRLASSSTDRPAFLVLRDPKGLRINKDILLDSMLCLDTWKEAMALAKKKAMTNEQFIELVHSASNSKSESVKASITKREAIFDLVVCYCQKSRVRAPTDAEMKEFWLNGKSVNKVAARLARATTAASVRHVPPLPVASAPKPSVKPQATTQSAVVVAQPKTPRRIGYMS